MSRHQRQSCLQIHPTKTFGLSPLLILSSRAISDRDSICTTRRDGVAIGRPRPESEKRQCYFDNTSFPPHHVYCASDLIQVRMLRLPKSCSVLSLLEPHYTAPLRRINCTTGCDAMFIQYQSGQAGRERGACCRNTITAFHYTTGDGETACRSIIDTMVPQTAIIRGSSTKARRHT
jgi:hypothetical protein